ncbi:dihydrolipoamide acetyltransferase family protein [Acaryochloris marina]|uniref:Dihydrolipoamide acetyltransferase component of pyruvate dehydrogenase complex n=1 Tax=Acaryochloris marina (strain MBIC 11017) TaxID=329726 RepID=B0C2A9_ACAM1|nr:dihydrolipoamide acetyltransferase family protein [Acaryochloris marina]ABW28561.1 pyruvate dehydrogenase complex dihydrolipoamide acetyltransferase [Acaryochloris marina MBIC11017]BDM77558.1 dihydrolipoamide acetyltransferase component of pyruvate dehydrogenase complex [Acaryochloris marina MBIC10699]
MIHEVFMPALSSTMEEGKIVSWSKEPGDKVEKGETVLVVESDKADMDVESFHEGYLAAIAVPAGGVAKVGAAIGYVAETEAEIAEAQKKASAAESAAPAPAAPAPAPAAPAPAAVAPAPPAAAPAPVATIPVAPAATLNGGSAPAAPSNGRVVVSPRARKLAKQFKVDLNTLTGSGPHGRIVAADIEAASGQTSTTATAPAASSAAPQPSLPASAPLPAGAAAGEVVPFNTLQQAVVNNMVASLAVPTFHVEYSIVTDALDQLYKQVKTKGVTMTALLAKAVAVTLRQHPLVNASCAPQGIQYSSAINIAVAVAMPGGGLITPVLQQADQMDLYSLSRTWRDLVARARSKQLQPDEYSTGTFTLSNLGMFGVNSFDAILPPGQGSILAIGGSKPQVVADDQGMMGVKRLMNVNITCDHRVIYGADAAAFLKDLAELIETNPQSLTL